jgi:UDP-N-acetylglucosamine 4,6-dehydratase
VAQRGSAPDRDALAQALTHRTVLITGAGFVASALLARLATFKTTEIRVLARHPHIPEMSRQHAGSVVPVAGDIRSHAVVADALRGVNVVIHTAGVKSVSAAESDPAGAISVNVTATRALLEAASRTGALEKFIAISSDKAADPAGVYGRTKAMAERLVAEAQVRESADLGSVRYGSLWGGAGSVITIWRKEGSRGDPISVTDPEMTRFVMRREEAIDLTLEAVGRRMAGAILAKPLPSYRLGDLAELVAEDLGVGIRIIGSRPGEKTHEDLISPAESRFADLKDGFYEISPGRVLTGTPAFSSANAVRLSRDDLIALLSEHTA